MPKLNTTLDNIETVANKVIGTTPSADWTDAQYPSAKTLYNTYTKLSTEIEASYPVGSIVCMSTNTNPASQYGGTWTLCDKEFAHKKIAIPAAAWTATNATFSSGTITLFGHDIMVHLQVVPSSDPGDTTTVLGKLNFAYSTIGLPSTLWFGRSQGVANSDGHNATMCYDFATDGTITSYDVLNVNGTHTLTSPTSYAMRFNDAFACLPADMPDKHCNKFYFKRDS